MRMSLTITKLYTNVYSCERIKGNVITSLMVLLFVSNITRRSTPNPHPLVGGNPYSSARQYSSFIECASRSPFSLSYKARSLIRRTGQNLSLTFTCNMNRRRCSSGSFNSEYAFTNSCPATNSSNLALLPGYILSTI
jgi:hypothetical protein